MRDNQVSMWLNLATCFVFFSCSSIQNENYIKSCEFWSEIHKKDQLVRTHYYEFIENRVHSLLTVKNEMNTVNPKDKFRYLGATYLDAAYERYKERSIDVSSNIDFILNSMKNRVNENEVEIDTLRFKDFLDSKELERLYYDFIKTDSLNYINILKHIKKNGLPVESSDNCKNAYKLVLAHFSKKKELQDVLQNLYDRDKIKRTDLWKRNAKHLKD